MSKINQQTKISEIIKANAESIDAIANLAKPLIKLKNPILRRLMASRVTIAEAASIGGCTIQDFRRVLEPLGFVFDEQYVMSDDDNNQAGSQEPAWFSTLNPKNTDKFDVRQLIASGGDPLKEIVQRYNALPVGHCLCIVNTFIPYPLIQVLGDKGATNYIQSESADVHYTWFLKAATPETLNITTSGDAINMLDRQHFETVLASYSQERTIVLDVRTLPMPQPMERILDTLASLENVQLIHVYHKRVPLHLLEELQNSEFQVRICEYGQKIFGY